MKGYKVMNSDLDIITILKTLKKLQAGLAAVINENKDTMDLAKTIYY